MSKTADKFVRALSAITLENVFNPYADLCPTYDRKDAHLRRQRNLVSSLNTAIDLQVRTIWIARDLGYRGGRRTGLALTDEVHLKNYSTLFNGMPVERATKGPVVSERTAAVIWKMLLRLSQPVFLWNVFPLHPHDPGEPMSNRCHTSREREACAHFLHEIIDLLKPEQVIAIGGDAHRAVDSLGISSIKVRHPSYGGQNDFIEQMESAYGLACSREVDLFMQPA